MIRSLLAAAAALCIAGTAQAQAIEAGDAGDLTGSAQNLAVGTGTAITSITGTIDDANDVDLYRIYLTGTGFSASTVNAVTGDLFDTKLYLFDSTGHAIATNDDSSGSSYAAALPLGNSLYSTLTGTYFLGISNGSREASNGPPPNQDLFVQETAGNQRFVRGAATGVNPATLGGYITSNLGFDDTGAYRIDLTGVSTGPAAQTAVPEPATWGLMVAGFAAAGVALRRRRTGRPALA